MATQPSTDWREQIGADEAARHAEQARGLTSLQAARTAKHGVGRALHRKGVLGLTATLAVKDGVPAHARHGLFAAPAAYDAWVRLSNGGPDVKADRHPDVRGFAVRVNGVVGDAALGGAATHQDLALINASNFGFADSKLFLSLVQAAAKGPLALIGWAYRSYGLRRMFGELKRLKASVERPFSGYASTVFHSAAPIACGPYAARVRLTPDRPVPHADARGEFGAAMAKTVAGGALAFTLALQFFVDEATTPIEDASRDWPEDVAPFVDVATLTIAQQDPASADGQALAARLERTVFDPWQALAAHRPLGEVMRARKGVYLASQQARDAQPG
ncbi:MAG: catalase [Myxococcales bacterium]|nr:catalase [Myxococcales bacterium]